MSKKKKGKNKIPSPKRNTPVFSTSSHKKKKVLECLEKIYNVISVLSTLSIFSCIVYFALGPFLRSNKSENDLIMNQIKSEISNKSEITSICIEDIHGLGNNSIIATTRSFDFDESEETNKVIILDLVENEFLQHINDPFGRKSSYKTTFSYSINVENALTYPIVEYVKDIVGDSTKEILVRYNYPGSTYGAYAPAVFKYSYDKMEYQLIGTYPLCGKLSLATYDDNGVISGFSTQIVDTFFMEDAPPKDSVMECTHQNEKFNLSYYSKDYCNSFWATGFLGNILIVVQKDYWNEDCYINIYEPIYSETDNQLKWNIIFSEYCDDSVDIYNQNDIENFIQKKFGKAILIETPGEFYG